jgi:hypothetical protein
LLACRILRAQHKWDVLANPSAEMHWAEQPAGGALPIDSCLDATH